MMFLLYNRIKKNIGGMNMTEKQKEMQYNLYKQIDTAQKKLKELNEEFAYYKNNDELKEKIEEQKEHIIFLNSRKQIIFNF
jgi:Ser-tRNA(Ala) deacylase AlaX